MDVGPIGGCGAGGIAAEFPAHHFNADGAAAS